MATKKSQKLAELQAKAEEGKYLIFKLNHEFYGIEILKVQEIIGMVDITRVPEMPEYIQGVINLRGRIIPVMDLRLKFGMNFREYSDRTCTIIVQIGRGESEMVLGIIVDEVSEVEDITADKIESAPQLGVSVDTTFIKGLGKINDKVTILLDIERIFVEEEVKKIKDVENIKDV